MPASVVIVDGIATSYVQQGKGPDVLLLHGWGDSKQTYKTLIAQLALTHRVTALDLPGFGASELPPAPWNLTDYATFLEHFCHKMHVAPGAVIGHSNGGALAIHAAAQGKIAPKKLILLAASGVRDTARLRRTAIKAVAKTGKLMTFWLPRTSRQRLQEMLYGTVGSDMLIAPQLTETFKRTVRQDVQADAKTISVPTLLIYGAADRATPAKEVGQRLHQQIKGSKLEIINGAGHFVHHDALEDVQRLIKDFL